MHNRPFRIPVPLHRYAPGCLNKPKKKTLQRYNIASSSLKQNKKRRINRKPQPKSFIYPVVPRPASSSSSMTLVHPPRRFDSCLNFRGDDRVDWVAAKVFVAVRHSSAPVLGLSPTTNDGQHKNTTGTYLPEEESRRSRRRRGEKRRKRDLHLILKRQIRIHVTLLRLARIHRHRRPHHRHCASRHNRRRGSVQDTLNVLSILQRDHRFALDIEARGGAIFFGVDVERVVAGVRSAADEFVIDLPAWFDVHGLARFEGAGGGCETCEAQGEGEGGGGE